MATIADLNVRLGLQIREFEANRRKAMRSIKQMGRDFQGLGNQMTLSITAPLLAIGGASLRASGQLEVMEKSLTSMMGSATAAKSEMEKLRVIAQDPGLNFDQAVKGSVRLQAVGVDADTARRALSAFGNAITLAGGTSSDLDGVTLALTQIISKGKVSAEEINQLAERVPQVRKAMMNLFGTADTEAIQKLGISSEEFVQKIIGEFEKLPKAQGGLLNSIENIGQAATQFLARIGDEINKSLGLQEVFESLAGWLDGLATAFTELSPETKKTAIEIAGLALAMGPLIKVAGYMVTGFQSAAQALRTFKAAQDLATASNTGFVSSMARLGALNPAATFGLIVAAIGAAVIAYRHFNREVDETAKVTVEAQKSIVGERLEAERLVNVIKDQTAKRSDQIAALNRLKTINKEYFGNLDIEKNSIQDINKALEGYVDHLLRVAKVKAAEQKLIELEQKRIELINDASKGSVIGDMAAALGINLAVVEAQQLQKELANIDKQAEKLAGFIGTNSTGGGGGSTSSGGGSTKMAAAGSPGKAGKETRQQSEDLKELLTTEQMYFAYGIEARSQMVESMTAVGITAELLSEKMVTAAAPIAEAWLNLGKIMKDAMEDAGYAMFEMALTGEASFKKLGKAALKSAADVVRSALMKFVANVIEKTGLAAGPLAPFVAPAAGALAGVAFNKVISSLKIPALAEGGIAMAPTLAMVGDNPGRGEAIIPLEKMGQVFGNAGGNVEVKILASPQGLLAMIEKAEKDRGRRSGF